MQLLSACKCHNGDSQINLLLMFEYKTGFLSDFYRQSTFHPFNISDANIRSTCLYL